MEYTKLSNKNDITSENNLVIKSICKLLFQLIKDNNSATINKDGLSASIFESKNIPNCSLFEFYTRFINYSNINYITIIYSIILIAKFTENTDIQLSKSNIFR